MKVKKHKKTISATVKLDGLEIKKLKTILSYYLCIEKPESIVEENNFAYELLKEL